MFTDYIEFKCVTLLVPCTPIPYDFRYSMETICHIN